MTDTTNTKPPLPGYPGPRVMTWSSLERDAIYAYGDARAAHAVAQIKAREVTSDECNAVTELRELIRGLDKTNWSSWQATDKFDPALNSAREWLADYDLRKAP